MAVSSSYASAKDNVTHNPGIEWSLVVLWCLLRSASLAKTLLHPLILQGHDPVSAFFFTVAFFLSSG